MRLITHSKNEKRNIHKQKNQFHKKFILHADRTFHFEIFEIMIITDLVNARLQLARGVLQLRMESIHPMHAPEQCYGLMLSFRFFLIHSPQPHQAEQFH